jgi:biopolymer transport protein ExbD
VRRASAAILALSIALAAGACLAQARTVRVRISSAGTCLIAHGNVPCSEAGAKLRQLGIPLNADIRINGGSDARYETIKAAMDSIRAAGYQLPIGFLTEAARPR